MTKDDIKVFCVLAGSIFVGVALALIVTRLLLHL